MSGEGWLKACQDEMRLYTIHIEAVTSASGLRRGSWLSHVPVPFTQPRGRPTLWGEGRTKEGEIYPLMCLGQFYFIFSMDDIDKYI